MCLLIIYLIHVYKQDFELNNLQWLIVDKLQLASILLSSTGKY